MSDLSGAVVQPDISGAPTPAPAYEQFVKVVKGAWDHNPKTKVEAEALYHYVMRSQIEPAINALLLACIADLPEAEQLLVKKVMAGTEIALTRCGCW